MALLDQTAPRGIPEVITTGIRLGMRTFLVIAALQLVVQLVNQFLTLHIIGDAMLHSAPPAFPWRQFGMIMLVMTVVGVFASAITLRYMWDAGTADSTDLGAAIGAAPRVALILLVQSVLYMIAFLLGSLLLIVPGVILLFGLILAPVAVVAEGLGPLAGLNRSWHLVWGRWWRTFGVFVCMGLAVIAVYLLLYWLGMGVDCDAPEGCEDMTSTGSQIWMLLQAAVNAACAPFAYGVMLALFHDLRFRVANLPLRTDPVT